MHHFLNLHSLTVIDLDEDLILLLERGFNLLAQDGFIQQILGANTHAGNLVRISRANAATSGADGALTQETLRYAVDRHVIRGDELRIRRNAQAGSIRPASLEAIDFFEQRFEVYYAAVADDRSSILGQHTGWEQLQLVLLATDNHGVARIVATIGLYHVINVPSEDVGSFPLTLVTPLGADDDDCCHVVNTSFTLTVVRNAPRHLHVAAGSRRLLILLCRTAKRDVPLSHQPRRLVQLPHSSRLPPAKMISMLYLLRCGELAHHHPDLHLPQPLPSPFTGHATEIVDTNAIPTRQELKVFDHLPTTYTTGHTSTLEEIAAQPDVAHQSTPAPDPHTTTEQVRIIVCGTDAALAAVVTKLMRIDALWAEVAFLPVSPEGQESLIATTWGLDAHLSPADALTWCLTSPALPSCVVRDDQAVVTLGAAELRGTDETTEEMIGEVVVDSDVLYHHEGGTDSPFSTGVRMVATADAPGLAAVQRPAARGVGNKKTSVWGKWREKWRAVRAADADPTVLTGRAMQAGGVDFQLVRDGVEHPRALSRVTFYRHLRDGQFVRRA